jgi:hypothetical protein
METIAFFDYLLQEELNDSDEDEDYWF